MIPLIPALSLAFLSFFSSVFVILRIVIPILPPHPLSRRVAPSEFGLPNFRSLSPADKSHIWLASLDILALAIFIWQTVNEYTGGPSDAANALDPASSLRLWLAMTIRQTCLLLVGGITLLHVRMGRSISFGSKHWMLWTPTLLLVATSTGIAVVLSGAHVPSLFIGLVSYATTIAVMSSIAFCCLVGTLLAIKRNLAVIQDESEPWPPVRQMEKQPRPSFATEEIDAIRDGASWITSNASNASSRHNSVSAWSFSTHAPSAHHGGRAQGSHPSVPAKSSFWFSTSTPADAPPVPPLPSPFGPLSPTAQSLSDPDPFRRDVPPDTPRQRLESQTSWLTSTNGSHKTVSAWSYPTTHHRGEDQESSHNGSSHNLNAELLPSNTAVTRPSTPAMASAKVLGGYGFAPVSPDAEKSLAALAASPGATIDISVYRAIGWLITIWVPLVLALPYLLLAPQNSPTPVPASVLLILSITLSSPLLALNLVFRSPLPIPHGLFDIRGELPTHVAHGPSRGGSVPTYKWSHEYKRSTSASVTVVEGRRSGDVWLTNGDAVDGKSKVGRAFGLMSPMPKLSVLPPEEEEENGQLTPPLPMQNEDSSMPITVLNSTQSEMSAQFGRLREDSASSRISAADESLAYASKIMVAQRHYSALAQTMHVSSSPEKRTSIGGHLVAASGVGPSRQRQSAHLRTRSGSSVQHSPTTESFSPSPPPSFPLPPTPPNVRAARLAHLKHKKSFSSGFSFGAVDDMNEIDALTAGVLPLLVPGLKVGNNMRIKDGDWTPPTSYSRAKGKRAVKRLDEFGGDFSSPEIFSTPARTRARAKKTSMHKRHHFSLPSLSLGKDGMHSLANWKEEVQRALEVKVGQYTAVPSNVDIGRRATIFGGEMMANSLSPLQAVSEEKEQPTRLTRGLSARRLGLQSDVPHDARASVESFNAGIPASAASTATLFEDFEAGLNSGPQAESTPHNTTSNKPTSKARPPPLPLPVPDHVRVQPTRRSSIVYISSGNDNFSPTAPQAEGVPPTPSAMASIAQWSSRVIAKPAKLQRKISDAVYGTTPKPGSPGLRPLALLQDRDTNMAGGGTPPLSLRKKNHKLRVVNDENVAPGVTVSGKRGVKPLQLSRSESNKARGMFRHEQTTTA
ncbi:hypothetical protein B0H15DRAFT_590840 [Mycena belliarum]|uniref:Uncharacterized protein n=1 Tax=Mycena belliarum TaxID=1033014 RepID=A0AAD6UJH5_9AGAR|nr:hypothetical protein B0H15DRAFT_590840 [Mycena belliae]